MSSKRKVQVDEIASAVMEDLTEYQDDIQEIVEVTTDEVTKEAKEMLVKISPKSKGSRAKPYYKGWAVKISQRGHTKYHKVIWNATNYQLTHLLEFGHHVWNAKDAEAKPHIQKVEEKYNAEFVDLVERRIRNGGKL